MQPLYDTRIGDLGPSDFMRVECGTCGHDDLIPTVGLTHGLRLPPHIPVLDLAPRLRCRECNAKGRAVVSITWGDGA